MKPSRVPARAGSVLLISAVLGLSLAACTPVRSVEAYCSTVKQHKARYLSAMSHASSENALAGLLDSAAAIGDLKSMWDDLAKVAPSDIQTDTETVRDAWDKANDKAADRNWFGAAAVALESAAPMQRVNDYIAKHCGVDAAPVSTGQSVSPAPTASAPATSVARLSIADKELGLYDYGPRSIITGDTGSSGNSPHFDTAASVDGAIEYGQGTVPATGTNADLQQLAYGAQQEASAAQWFVVATVSHEASSGLNPETWTTYLQRYAAGGQTATTTVTFAGCAARNCDLDTVTLFGDVAVLAYTDPDGTPELAGINLTNSQVVWMKRAVRPVASSGSLVVVQGGDPNDDSATTVSAINGETGQTAWDYRDGSGKRPTAWGLTLSDRYAVILSPSTPTDYLHTRRANLVDLQTGRTITSRFAAKGEFSGAFDPLTQRIVLAHVSKTPDGVANLGGDLEVLNTDGSAVYGISAARYAQLDEPMVLGSLGGRVWISTQGTVDIFDSSTGAQDATSPKVTGSSDPVTVPTLIDGSVAVVSTDGIDPSKRSSLAIVPTGTPSLDEITTSN